MKPRTNKSRNTRKSKIKYSDEPIGKIKIIKDFLPPIKDLVFKNSAGFLNSKGKLMRALLAERAKEKEHEDKKPMPIPKSLSRKKCLPCEGGAEPLSSKETKGYLKTLPGWRLGRGGKEIEIEYKMRNFMAAIGLIQNIARIAEKENHHPDLHLTSYRLLKISLSTHAIRGLSLNDFILAAKIQKLQR